MPANTSISNNKTSHLVSSQVPFFVRNDHSKFVLFLETYYKYLEQENKATNRAKNLNTYRDVDLTIDEFSEKLYQTFMKYVPKDVMADKNLIIKHIKDFYRAKGSENATRFLFRIMFNEEIEFYYPKSDILRFSDGKWFVQKTLRVNSTNLNGNTTSSLVDLEKFVGTRVTGNTSNATAIVERVDRFYENGALIDELIISNVSGTFRAGEIVFTLYNDVETQVPLYASLYSGFLASISISNAGAGYTAGYSIPIESMTGNGAIAVISSVSSGDIPSITVYNGGAGFQSGNFVLVTGGGGSGANANVSSVLSDNTVHPNVYNVVSSTISLEANTTIGNAIYSNLSSTNANVAIANAMSFWRYTNTGPARTVLVLNPGALYTSAPSLSVVANSTIQQLGILGRMEIVNGGQNYRIGDTIEFINVPGGYGVGATANVTNVDSSRSNAISQVRFQIMPGHTIGGSGYTQTALPTANVITSTGNGANIMVTAILGSGATLTSANTTIGAIQRIIILNGGSGYLTSPTINLRASGDGTAQANGTIIQGIYTYPGRFLNDDGMFSSYNFIEDRDYYQSFSYVIKSSQSIERYRNAAYDLTHPAGMKMFGEYQNTNEIPDSQIPAVAEDTDEYVIKYRSYTKTGNTINISYTSHGIQANANVYLEYRSGGYSNVVNGLYRVRTTATNYLIVFQNVSTSTSNTSGDVEIGVSIAR